MKRPNLVLDSYMQVTADNNKNIKKSLTLSSKVVV